MDITASRKDLASALIFVVIGAFFAIEALNYDLGTPLRMGPGFMPVLLGGVLVLLGLLVGAVALWKKDSDAPSDPVAWRAIVLIIGAILFFGLTIRGLGFVPVTFITAAVTALSSRDNNPVSAALIAAALTVLCLLIFVVGLGLIVPWFGPWLPV